MCYDDGFDFGFDDGCDQGCDCGIIAAIVAGSALLLLLVIGGIVALALIPVYLNGKDSNKTINNGTLVGPGGEITASALNGNLLAAGTSTGRILIRDLTNGGSFLASTTGRVTGLQFVGNSLVSVTNSGQVRFWDVTTGNAVNTFNLPNNAAATSVISGGNNEIYIGSTDGNVYVYNTNGNLLRTINAGSPVRSLGKLTSGNIVVGTDAAIQTYSNTNPNTLLNTIPTVGTLDSMIVTAPTNGIGESIVYSSGNNLRVFNPTNQTLLRTIPTSAPVRALTQTGTGILASAENTAIRFYNLANGNVVDTISNANPVVNTLNFRSNNDIIAGNSLGSINFFNRIVQNLARKFSAKMLAVAA